MGALPPMAKQHQFRQPHHDSANPMTKTDIAIYTTIVSAAAVARYPSLIRVFSSS